MYSETSQRYVTDAWGYAKASNKARIERFLDRLLNPDTLLRHGYQAPEDGSGG